MSAQFIKYNQYISYPESEMLERSGNFYNEVNRRRSVRMFSDKKVDRQIIENCILSAGTAPSGANLQPWHFVAVNDTQTKKPGTP